MTTTFLLIRHGRTAVTDRISGWTPGVRLSDRGRDEVAALCRRLEGVPIAAVYSSPLERALETAEPIARQGGVEVQILRDVGEIDFGDWTGRSFRDLDAGGLWRSYNSFRSGIRIPAGESMLEVQARMVLALDRLRERHPRTCVAVVSHGDPIKCVVAHYGGISLDLFSRFEVATASVSVLRIGSDSAQLLRVNDAGPIRECF